MIANARFEAISRALFVLIDLFLCVKIHPQSTHNGSFGCLGRFCVALGDILELFISVLSA